MALAEASPKAARPVSRILPGKEGIISCGGAFCVIVAARGVTT